MRLVIPLLLAAFLLPSPAFASGGGDFVLALGFGVAALAASLILSIVFMGGSLKDKAYGLLGWLGGGVLYAFYFMVESQKVSSNDSIFSLVFGTVLIAGCSWELNRISRGGFSGPGQELPPRRLTQCVLYGLMGVSGVLLLLGFPHGSGGAMRVPPEFAAARARSLEELRANAMKGDAGAQLGLGQALDHGLSVATDSVRAAMWYRKAADQGSAEAQAALGEMYRLGHGVDENMDEALRWYRKAAEQGNVAAENRLGDVYGGGYGVTRDDAEALKWYLRAADQGDNVAALSLADIYAGGRGVARDFLESCYWLDVAAAGFDNEGQQRCLQTLTEEQRLAAQKRAFEKMRTFRKAD